MPRHPVTGKIIASKLLEKINTHEIAWAAGFFDGEGTTYTQLGKWNPRLRLSVSQKSGAILYRFKKAVLHLGIISSEGNAAYRFRSDTFETAQAVIAILWKYLDYEKREQAKKALKKYHENYRYLDGNRRGWTPEIRDKAIERRRAIAEMNKINGNSTNPPVPATEKAVKVESEEQRK